MAQKRVLIVDDNSDTAFILQTIFQSDGYQTIPAQTADDGFELASAELPDLIYIVLMPPELGIQLLGQMRGDNVLQSIPIILYTSIAEDWRQAGKEAGANEILTMPVSRQHVIAAAARLMGEESDHSTKQG